MLQAHGVWIADMGGSHRCVCGQAEQAASVHCIPMQRECPCLATRLPCCRGSSGRVFLCMSIDDHHLYAVKVPQRCCCGTAAVLLWYCCDTAGAVLQS
jgi:hypothetical protein